MYHFSYKVWGDADPAEKPKIFFTSHAEDFEPYFRLICDDIFRHNVCVIYYASDTAAAFDRETQEALLEMDLFVVPVTAKLLTTSNRTIGTDLPFATERGIPVLPIVLESGLTALYRQAACFGSRHYLSPLANSVGGIGYQEKLDRFLQTVLAEDAVKQAIKEAFDAHIFMSYRHLDRIAAAEFMRLVHRIKEFRDIAIWYDDFLIPGHNFRQSLEEEIRSCDLFALIVTPNLFADANNYVLRTELPLALSLKRPLLASEMTRTEAYAQYEHSDRLPLPVDPHDEDALRREVLLLLQKKTVGARLDDPYRQFLMGAAYLWGVEVEHDRERALSLLTTAAEADELNAQRLLRNMYEHGSGVSPDYRKALYWAKRYSSCCHAVLGDDARETFSADFALADCFDHAGQYRDELAQWKALLAREEQRPQDDGAAALRLRANIAACLESLGNYEEAYRISGEVYEAVSARDGEDSLNAILVLGNIGDILYCLNDAERAVSLTRRAVALAEKKLGKPHPYTLFFRNNLGLFLLAQHHIDEAEENLTNVLRLREQALGAEHPLTLDTTDNLGLAAMDRGDYDEAFRLLKKTYELRRRVLGEDHPVTRRSLESLFAVSHQVKDGYRQIQALIDPMRDAYESSRSENGSLDSKTLSALSRLTDALMSAGQFEDARKLLEESYTLGRQTLGEKDETVIEQLGKFTNALFWAGDYTAALDSAEKCCIVCREVFGKKHAKTLKAMRMLAAVYSRLGFPQKALATDEAVYRLSVETLGEEHPDTLFALQNLADGHFETGDPDTAERLTREAYEKRCRVLGEVAKSTALSLSHLSIVLYALYRYREAIEAGRRAYALQSRYIGCRHPDTLRTLSYLASSHLRLHHYAQAKDLSELACDLARGVYPDDYPAVQTALHTLAETYRETGEPGKALEVDTQIYQTVQRKFPPTSERIVSVLKDLATDGLFLHNAEIALEHSKKAYDLECGKKGKTHPDALTAGVLYARSRSLGGDCEAAFAMLDECCEGLISALGEEHPHVIITLLNTASCIWNDSGDAPRAIEKAERAYILCRKVFKEDHPLTEHALGLLEDIRTALSRSERTPDSVMKAIRSVKAARHYDRLMMGDEARRAAENAAASFAREANLDSGFAVQQTRRGFPWQKKCRGILFTAYALYSDQLPEDGLPYSDIQSVSLNDLTIIIRLTDGTRYSLELGASGPDAAAALQAACKAGRVQTP